MQALPEIRLSTSRPTPGLWAELPSDRPQPLQQHPGYARALSHLGADMAQITFHDRNQTVAAALVSRRRLYRAVQVSSLLRGPSWIVPDPTPVQEAALYRALRQAFNRWRWQFLMLQPDLPDTPEASQLMRSAGFRRILTGYTTAWMDLEPDESSLRAQLSGKWRNQLKAAEKADLVVNIGGRKPHHYAWLLEKEEGQRKRRGYHALPTGFVIQYADEAGQASQPGVLSATALAGRDKVAGALFLLHGNSATYHVGWVGEDGRRMNAQNRLLWEAVLALKGAGIRFLDLGGLETASQPGIARFKLGMGAPPVTYTGTWA